jgi:hypothetical protein
VIDVLFGDRPHVTDDVGGAYGYTRRYDLTIVTPGKSSLRSLRAMTTSSGMSSAIGSGRSVSKSPESNRASISSTGAPTQPDRRLNRAARSASRCIAAHSTAML